MYKTSQAHPNLVAQIVPSPLTFRVDRTIQDLLTCIWATSMPLKSVAIIPALLMTVPCTGDIKRVEWTQYPVHGHLVRSLHALGRSGNAGICPHTRLCGAAP